MAVNTLDREALIERAQNPRFSTPLSSFTHGAEGANMSCGDEITWQIEINPEGRIVNIAHRSRACSVCIASADLLAESLIGKKLENIEDENTDSVTSRLGIELSPTRLKCALLPLSTLKNLEKTEVHR